MVADVGDGAAVGRGDEAHAEARHLAVGRPHRRAQPGEPRLAPRRGDSRRNKDSRGCDALGAPLVERAPAPLLVDPRAVLDRVDGRIDACGNAADAVRVRGQLQPDGRGRADGGAKLADGEGGGGRVGARRPDAARRHDLDQ
eukprot:5406209-Prymnesium_polylepis.1